MMTADEPRPAFGDADSRDSPHEANKQQSAEKTIGRATYMRKGEDVCMADM
jgi:hypothetical protein